MNRFFSSTWQSPIKYHIQTPLVLSALLLVLFLSCTFSRAADQPSTVDISVESVLSGDVYSEGNNAEREESKIGRIYHYYDFSLGADLPVTLRIQHTDTGDGFGVMSSFTHKVIHGDSNGNVLEELIRPVSDNDLYMHVSFTANTTDLSEGDLYPYHRGTGLKFYDPDGNEVKSYYNPIGFNVHTFEFWAGAHEWIEDFERYPAGIWTIKAMDGDTVMATVPIEIRGTYRPTFTEIFTKYEAWGKAPQTWSDGSTTQSPLVGIYSSGGRNNFMASTFDSAAKEYSCKSMQWKTLIFLNELKDKGELGGWNYMPVKSWRGIYPQHNAVAIWKEGQDIEDGYILDPFYQQKPAYYSSDTHWSAQSQYPGEDEGFYHDVYPDIDGGAAEIGGYYVIQDFEKHFPPPWITSAVAPPPAKNTSGYVHIGFHCRVDIVVENSRGERLGRTGEYGEWLTEFEPIDAYFWQDPSNDERDWFFLLPPDEYTISLYGDGPGEVEIFTAFGDGSIHQWEPRETYYDNTMLLRIDAASRAQMLFFQEDYKQEVRTFKGEVETAPVTEAFVSDWGEEALIALWEEEKSKGGEQSVEDQASSEDDGDQVDLLEDGEPVASESDGEVVLEDAFDASKLDNSQWDEAIAKGYIKETGANMIFGIGETVLLDDGVLILAQNDTDNGGAVVTDTIRPVDGKVLRLRKRTMLHPGGSHFRAATFVLKEDLTNLAYITYYQYNDVDAFHVGYLSSEVSFSSIWDEWFTEEILYDPASGELSYSINGSSYKTATFMPTDEPFRIGMYGYGWYTGHWQAVDHIQIDWIDADNADQPSAWLPDKDAPMAADINAMLDLEDDHNTDYDESSDVQPDENDYSSGIYIRINSGTSSPSPFTGGDVSLKKGDNLSLTLAIDDSVTGKYDVYIAVFFPDGHFYCLTGTSSFGQEDTPIALARRWSAEPIESYDMLNLRLPIIPTGEYTWYFVLTPPDANVYNDNDWTFFSMATMFFSGSSPF